MKLSIITINYNNCSGLQKTLHSIISQTCRDFEWIVIDGGSSDGSREIIEQYQNEMAYWCSEPDKGIYHAMNKGIARAHGEYLQFLNSGDMLADKNVIKNVITYLIKDDIYLANMYLGSRVGKPVVNPISVDAHHLLHTLVFKAIMHPSSYIKRDCFVRFGVYNEELCIISDWWFFYRAIVVFNASVSYVPVVAAVYDENGISSTQKSLICDEKSKVWNDNIVLGQLTNFYKDNFEIIEALKGNRIVFFLFRFYFIIYRLFMSK